MINDYFKGFSVIIDSTGFIVDSEIHKRKINDFLGIIEGKLLCGDYMLDILEVIEIIEDKLIKKKYKYHLRGLDENDMIFRYDNAPHHQDVQTYPHHKHLPDNKTIDSNEPDITQVLSEIRILLNKYQE
jgi:hypothetical protein